MKEVSSIVLMLVCLICFIFIALIYIKSYNLFINKPYMKNELNLKDEINDNEIIISFVGDCTLGTGANYSYSHSFIEKYNKVNDDSYFFSGVSSKLETDFLTIANLEGVLSNQKLPLNPKKYNYKGPSKYANILKVGSVEMVNVANNHTYDYYKKGYDDTLESVKNYNVLSFGYNNYQIVEVKDVRIGIFGLTGWDYGSTKKEIDKALNYFHDMDIKLVIGNFHWGEMDTHYHNNTQELIAKYAIDKGVDLVIGHHSHVLQGIEKYKDKYIVYSLGNFVYGGIYYPYDSDSMILRMHYKIENGEINNNNIEIVPVSITSSGKLNDFKPKILTGKQRERVLKNILSYSTNFNYNLEEE